MQNSFGKLEHSNLKCSPIFQKNSTEQTKKEGDGINQNFSYNSIMQNRATKINSKFEGVEPSDLMTPIHRQGACQEVQIPIEEQRDEHDILGQKLERSKIQSKVFFGPRTSNASAFLLNYGEGGGKNSELNHSNLDQSNQTPFKPIYGHGLNRADPNSKLQSSIFAPKNQNLNQRDTLRSSISKNNISSSNFSDIEYENNNISPKFSKNLIGSTQSQIKVREVIKQSDYEKKYSNKRILTSEVQNNSDEFIFEDLESEDFEEQRDSESKKSENEESCNANPGGYLFNRQIAFMQKNFSSGENKNSKIKTISEVTEFLKNKRSSEKSLSNKDIYHNNQNFKSHSPGFNEFISHKRYGAPRKSAEYNNSIQKSEKIKSIKNIVDSNFSKKIKDGLKKKRTTAPHEDLVNPKLKKIEVNKFTKKIIEESYFKYQNDSNFPKIANYDVYNKKSHEEKLVTLKRKMSRLKKSDLPKADIQIIQNEPMSFENIECKVF
jgi:hypothetical protein